LQVHEFRCSTDAEIDFAFKRVVQQRIGAIMVTAGPFFDTRREKLVTLAAHYAVPTMYHFREFAAAGGLISYGIDARVIYRQIGVYAGAILKGEKPAELPVLLPTKFELVINLKTAKALGLRVPLTLQAMRCSSEEARLHRAFGGAAHMADGGARAAADRPSTGRISRRGIRVYQPVLLRSLPPRDAGEAFRQGMREHGYIDGQNVTLVEQWAEGRSERFSELIGEVIALKPNIILAVSLPAAIAANNATATIPIVFIASDPLGSGLIESLARPGRNLTGFSLFLGDEFSSKWLELLTQAVPGASRVAVIWNPLNPASSHYVNVLRGATGKLGVKLQLEKSATQINSTALSRAWWQPALRP
jgi:ABC-type uncharacterized transport system substrate-binding protein